MHEYVQLNSYGWIIIIGHSIEHMYVLWRVFELRLARERNIRSKHGKLLEYSTSNKVGAEKWNANEWLVHFYNIMNAKALSSAKGLSPLGQAI